MNHLSSMTFAMNEHHLNVISHIDISLNSMSSCVCLSADCQCVVTYIYVAEANLTLPRN